MMTKVVLAIICGLLLFPWIARAQGLTYPLIAEVYYDVAQDKGQEGDNEWVKLYNPSDSNVDLSGWQICDNQSCDTLPSVSILPGGLAIVTAKATTWDYWSVSPKAIKIVLDSKIGGGLANGSDRVILKNAQGTEIDAMSYGADNYAFSLDCPDVAEGHSLQRQPIDQDTNQASDFIDNPTPNLETVPEKQPSDSVKGIKEAVKSSLEEAKTGDKKVDQKIDKILVSLEKSLDNSLWSDENHLDFQKGEEVFQAEARAVRKMKFFLRLEQWFYYRLPESVKYVFGQAIADLIKADKMLVGLAIEEAKNTAAQNSNKPRIVERLITQAEAKLRQTTITQYGLAWHLAQKAITLASDF